MDQIQAANYSPHNKRTVYGAALLVTVMLIIFSRALAVLWPGFKTLTSFRCQILYLSKEQLEQHVNNPAESNRKQKDFKESKHIANARQRVRQLVQERMQSLPDISSGHPAHEAKTKVQINSKGIQMPTSSNTISSVKPSAESRNRRQKPATTAFPPPLSRTNLHITGDDSALCHLPPASGSGDRRLFKPSQPAVHAAAAPHDGPLREPPSAAGSLRYEAEGGDESSDDGDVLDDVIRDPITLEVMRDPVVAADGHTYERAGAERWFARHGAVSMVTGAALPHINLVPNQAVRRLIARARPDVPLAPWRPLAAPPRTPAARA